MLSCLALLFLSETIPRPGCETSLEWDRIPGISIYLGILTLEAHMGNADENL